MTTQETAQALVDWAVSIRPEFGDGQPYAPKTRSTLFPDLAVEIVAINSRDDDGEFPSLGFEQVALTIRSFDVVIVVDAEPPDVPKGEQIERASAELAAIVDALIDAARVDQTGGGRFQAIGRAPSASFRPAFVVFDDRTKGRQATLSLRVADITNDTDEW